MPRFLLSGLLLSTFFLASQAFSTPRLAILDIVSRIKTETIDTAVFSESIMSELVKTGKVTVLEREGLYRIIEEQKFQLSGMTESEITRVGKLAGAEFTVYGSLSRLDSQYILTVKAVNVQNGTVEASDQCKGATLAAILNDIPRLARLFSDTMTGRKTATASDPGSSSAASSASSAGSVSGANKPDIRWFPIQIALWEPLQITPKEMEIYGLSLSLGLSENAGCIGTATGLGGIVNGDMAGFQANLFNWTRGNFYGFQFGLVNFAEKVVGLQIGIFNYAVKMEGIQIGVVNIIRDGWVPFIPIVNLYF